MRNESGGGRKALYVIISLLIAAGIWLYVDSTLGTKVTVAVDNIPIEYVGEDTTLADRGLMLLSGSDEAVSLKLSGTRKVISRLDPEKIRIQADLSNVTGTGRQNVNYKIIYPGNVSSGSVTVTYASAYAVTVSIGELYSKEVEIHCVVEGAVADGYIAGQVELTPGTLQIRGQQADIDPVSYAEVTLKVDNATSSVTKMLDYTLYDTNGDPVDMTNIHATSDQIQVTLPVNVVKELPLAMNFIEAAGSRLKNVSYTITPASITVSGDAELLKDVTSITLDDFKLADLNGTTTYNYAITVPDGCKNVSGVTRATLKIAFKDLTSTTLTITQFSCTNIPDGKTVTILTDELPVTLRGTSADIAAITPDMVSVIADLKDVSSASGSYTVPAKVQVNSDGDIGAVGSYQIKLTISEAGSETNTNTDTNTETGGAANDITAG